MKPFASSARTAGEPRFHRPSLVFQHPTGAAAGKAGTVLRRFCTAGIGLGLALALLSCGGASGGAGGTPDTGDGRDACGDGCVEWIGPGPDLVAGDQGQDADLGRQGDGAVQPGEPGWACVDNSECLSGWCVPWDEGNVCTRTCLDSCDNGWECRAVAGTYPDVTFVCVPAFSHLCQSCVVDRQCGGGFCLSQTDGKACARPCGPGLPCPSGFNCEQRASEEDPLRVGGQCVPVTGLCSCSLLNDGEEKTCVVENEFGQCWGTYVCDGATGWGPCSGGAPTEERCDGLDNDCNGVADDNPPPPAEPCAITNEFGTCNGVYVCLGTAGWDCTAAEPGEEVCDYFDNDCDGEIDEGFREAFSDRYATLTNCGVCGNDCTDLFPHATPKCDDEGAEPRCAVDFCEDNYFQASEFACLPIISSLCLACNSDENCAVPGDLCLDIGGGRFCGRDCGEGSIHGAECPDGYVCTEARPDAFQCMPAGDSCACLPETDGHQRTCLRSNEFGTCYGDETCEVPTGWVNCNARTPAAEVCDDVDNDCNGYADDLSERGNACTIENTAGACPGLLDCVAGEAGLVCVGQTPGPETCNYVDDDCNGETDEGFDNLYDSCSAGIGQCTRYGFIECTGDGSGTRCNAQAGLAASEICDNRDNDCDSQTDETWPLKGEVCTVGQGVCTRNGVWVCAEGGGDIRCSVTPGAPDLGGEVCDSQDNDCDGLTDETWLHNGKYDADTACGNCQTDCTTVFARDHAYGVCDAAGVPACEMVCCRSGDANPRCAGGGNYYDLNGVPNDGCEFLLDPNAVYVSISDPLSDDGATCGLGPVGTNVPENYRPCRTIARGLARAVSLGRARIYVAAGAYIESVTLVDGKSLYGGYNATNWGRSAAANLTAIFGNTTTGHRKTIIANGIRNAETTLDGFVIYGENATTSALNAYAVYVRDCDSALRITNNVVWAGSGGPGVNGSPGTDGANGPSGASGLDAYEPTGTYGCYEACINHGVENSGGLGGQRTCGTLSVNGGNGGRADCPDFNQNVNQCTTCDSTSVQTVTTSGLQGANSGGAGGLGGCDSQFHRDCRGSCICYNASCPQQRYASPGENGAAGVHGLAGAACAASAANGSVVNDEWVGTAGGGGGDGSAGRGGGGGGAGGGVETRDASSCDNDGGSDVGGSGGGGGAGGCSGTGGSAGTAGGGSFALFVRFRTAPGADIPVIQGNEFHRAYGGNGGNGGNGGSGGAGGNGGNGGQGGVGGSSFYCAGPGANGGAGGDGGHGGGGGGACGGVSFGIYASGQGATNLGPWRSPNNTFATGGGGGSGGQGGGTGNGGNPGGTGASGGTGATNF